MKDIKPNVSILTPDEAIVLIRKYVYDNNNNGVDSVTQLARISRYLRRYEAYCDHPDWNAEQIQLERDIAKKQAKIIDSIGSASFKTKDDGIVYDEDPSIDPWENDPEV